MSQLTKQRAVFRLLIVFIGLQTCRHMGWMLVYEQFAQTSEKTINLGFILYSAIILLTALTAPRLLKRWNLYINAKQIRIVFGVAYCAAFLCLLLQLKGSSYLFFALFTILIMICMCACFGEIFTVVPTACLGRFFGTALCVDAAFVSMVEQWTGTAHYYSISVWTIGVLSAIALLAFLWHPTEEKLNYAEYILWSPNSNFVILAGTAIILYALTAGLIDNLYFFDELFGGLPFAGKYTLPMMAAFYMLNGFIFDFKNWKVTVPLAFLIICVAQSMCFFIREQILAYTYSVLSNYATTFLELCVLIFPIIYSRNSKHGISLSAIGDGIYYGGFCMTSILFMVLTQEGYRYIMGTVLLLALAGLLLLIKLVSMYHEQKQSRMLEIQRQAVLDLEQQVANANALVMPPLSQSHERADFQFTKRETELLPYILSSLTAEEIALQTQLSVSTIRFHIRNILSKSGAKNRRELARTLGAEVLPSGTTLANTLK